MIPLMIRCIWASDSQIKSLMTTSPRSANEPVGQMNRKMFNQS